jgi:serine protease
LSRAKARRRGRDDRYTFEFLAPGAPDRARPMELVVTARLPEGSRAWLEAPLTLIDAMNERSPFVKSDDERGVGLVPVNPHGVRPLGTAVFPARSRAKLRLLVKIPAEFRRYAYEVSVGHRYQGQEIGRIAWRLGPRVGKRRPAAAR